MLDVCQHPHIRMREWGVQAMTFLVKSALQYKYEPPLKNNQVSNIYLLVHIFFFLIYITSPVIIYETVEFLSYT